MANLLLGKLSDSSALDLVNRRVNPDMTTVERLTEEQSDLANMAFYFGKQHFVQRGAQLIQPQMAKHRVFYKANMVIGAVQRAVSKIMSVRGKPHVLPERLDRVGLQAAKVSKRVLEDHLLQVSRYEEKKRLAYTWSALTGSCWLKTYWNPNTGESNRWYLEDDKSAAVRTFSPEEAREREDRGLYEDIPLGDVAVGVVHKFQAFYDLDARESMDDCEWFAQQQFISRERVIAMFGTKYRDVESGGQNWQSYQFQEAIAFMQTGFPTPATSTHPDRNEDDMIRVVEMWERPSALNNKKGRRVITIGDTVHHNGPNPYAWSKYPSLHLPFVKCDWWTMPGKFTGISLAEQLRSPQFQYNKSRSVMVEMQNVFGQPATFVQKGGSIPAGAYTIEPGAVYEIDKTEMKPWQPQPPQLPKEISENASRTMGDFNAIAADASPGMGDMPSAIRASSMLRQMLEEKNAVLSPTAHGALIVDEHVGRNLLALAQHYYTEQRTMRYVGEDGDYMVQSFMGADLVSDLKILGKPDTSFSDGAAKAELLELIQLGFLDPTNPEDKALGLRAFELDSTDELKKRKMRGELTQENEIRRMIEHTVEYATAGGYPAKEYDNHVEHLRVLTDFMQTREFEELDPSTCTLIEQHWKQHQAWVMAQMRMMQEASPKPANPPKGEPSKPKPSSQTAK